MIKYFKGSYLFSFIGIILTYLWTQHIAPGKELTALFIVFILSILEISLSFDNAVINAGKLEKMSSKWQHRFLTWGIFIAVFGMRFLFPVLIVSIFSKVGLNDVINMAVNNADKYAYYLKISHPSVITFGGCFLMMLFLTFMFNQQKDVHWLKFFEKKLQNLGSIKGLNVCITLIILLLTQNQIPDSEKHKVMIAGLSGIITYILIEGIAHKLEQHSEQREKIQEIVKPKMNIVNAGLVNFLYLELIDASFSLDGVLGAFALSKDIVIITIGLSIGAMFVRSLTIMLVEKKTLKQYVYLENGAHWAIGGLAIVMFLSSFIEISEIITGGIGLFFIIWSLVSSIKNKQS